VNKPFLIPKKCDYENKPLWDVVEKKESFNGEKIIINITVNYFCF
jgi:hypothetical protein